jgi:hypothetical protein
MARDVDELWEDEPQRPAPYVDGAWGRTANPNTADGELQNIAAFGTGLTRLTGWRRTAARVIVVAILVSLILSIIVGVAHAV